MHTDALSAVLASLCIIGYKDMSRRDNMDDVPSKADADHAGFAGQKRWLTFALPDFATLVPP